MHRHERAVPKPLVEVGGRPILWHVMSIYAAHGLTHFVLLLGEGAEQVEAFASTLDSEWTIDCVRTGADTPTGGRIARTRDRMGDGTFCLTYADGVADIDIDALLDFHRSHGGKATMTVVQPTNPWGVATLGPGDRVHTFVEKPPLESWVNGGFLVLEQAALDAIEEDDVLERGPLERLVAAGELHAFRHEGFWDCLDTHKDTLLLNRLWEEGRAPWRVLVEA